MINTLYELEQSRQKIENEIKSMSIRHKEEKNKIDNELQHINKEIALHCASLDPEKIHLAESLIRIEGLKWRKSGDCPNAIKDAINDIVDGCVKIRREYFGCKNYDRWTCQRNDSQYGYGPRHGSIVFRIGLKNTNKDFSEDELEAMIYYLRNLDIIAELDNN